MRTKAIILTVLLFVLGTTAFGWWSTHSQVIFSQLKNTLAAELTQALNTKVDIGQIQAAGLRSASVNNVILFDKQGREMAAIKQVTIEYNLLSLVRGRTAIDAVRKLTLSGPDIKLVEEADGIWNIECLKQNNQPDSTGFTGKVVIEQATVSIQALVGNWTLTGGEGQLGIRDSQAIDVNLTASHDASPVSVQGFIDSTRGSLSLSVKAGQLKPAAYNKLLPAGTDIIFTGGTLNNIDVTLAKSATGLSYAGEFRAEALAATAAGITVEQGQGQVSFTNNNIYILGSSALVAGQPVTIRGKIGVAGEQPVLDLSVTSSGFDLAAVSRSLPFAGVVAFTGKVTGTLKSPNASAQLSAENVIVSGYRLRQSSANISFAGKLLTVSEFATQMLGGQIRGQGIFDTSQETYQVQLTASNIDAAAISGLPVTLSGSGDITLAVNGRFNDWKNMNGLAVVTLANGAVEGMPYAKMNGIIERSGNITEIKHYNLLLPSGLITAAGSIQEDKLNIKVEGQGIELTDLPFAAIKNISFAGKAGFQGDITGTTAQPQLGMTFNAANVTMNQQTLGQVSGVVKASSDSVSVEQVTISDGAARHELSGTIRLAGARPEVRLTLLTHSARAETFSRLLLPEIPLTGNIEHELTLSGPIDNLTAHGRLRLSEGSLAGYLVAQAEGTYERQNGVITVNELNINSLGTKVKLSGTVAADNSLNFAVTAENIDITRIKAEYPYPVAGLFNLTGQVTGNVLRPEASAQLTSGEVLLNGQELKNMYASLTYSDGQADIRELRFAQGQGNYVFNGAVDIKTHGIDGRLRASGGELAGILAIANSPDHDIRGKLNGEIVLSGSIENPNILLRGAIENGKIKNYLLDRIDVDAELTNKVITIKKFMATQGADGVLVAAGRADLNGEMDFEVGGRAIDAGIIAALFDTTVDTKGKISFNAQAGGATIDPNVSVSLEVQNGSVANAEFDNLYGLFIYNKGSIHVNQLFLSRGAYKASAYGVVPLKALNSQGRNKADRTDTMDLKLRLDHADLSILPLLTKDIAWASGPTTGEIAIGGTLSQPTLDGKVAVVNGTIKLKALADPIQKVGIDIRFKGDKIEVNAFDGEMGGGSYSLNGSARLNGLALDDYDLMLTLARLGVSHKYFDGPLEGVLSLTSQKGKPHIYGKLNVSNATINIPAVPDSGEIDFDAGLDVEFVVGDKVRMYNPYLYDFKTAGKVKFSGTLKRPEASGRIEALRGTVKYLTNRFTIVSGSAEFTQYRSIEPIIKLQAVAKLERTTINLAINGRATAMDLKLTSEPAMSQQEIISLLTLRGGYFSKSNSSGNDSSFGRDELVSLLDAGLQMRFIAEVESSLQDTLGVDEFRLVRSSLFDTSARGTRSNQSDSQFQGYNIEIGKYLTDKLLLSYTMGLDQHNNSIGFRYDFTRNIGIGGSFGGNAKSLLTVETRFAF